MSAGFPHASRGLTEIDSHARLTEVGDAHLLFNAGYERVGSDLLLSDESGPALLIRGYFSHAELPALASPAGALLSGQTVRALSDASALQLYAQTGPAAGADLKKIGVVEQLDGTATATHENGTVSDLKTGDTVYQGDIIQTGGGTHLAITFADGTVFTMSADARMVLDSMIYEPGGGNNSMVFSLVQGGFSFVAGQVAPTGDMKINTPVATMGIRGTAPYVIVANDGATQFAILPDPNSDHVGTYQLFNLTTGELIGTVSQVGTRLVLQSALDTPLSEAQTVQQLLDSQEVQQQLTAAYQQSLNNPYVNQSTESSSYSNPGSGNGNYQPPGDGGNGGGADPGDLLPDTENGDGGPNTGEGPPPPPVKPSIVIPASVTVVEDSGPNLFGGLAIYDPDSPNISVNINVNTTFRGAQSTFSLAPGSLAGLTFSAGDGTADSFMSFTGSPSTITAALAGLRYDPAPNLDVADSITITVSDGIFIVTKTLPVNVIPVPDAPFVNADTNWAHEDNTFLATGNVLADQNHPGAPSGGFADTLDYDVDTGDTISVSAVQGSAGNIGQGVQGAYGTLTVQANGNYVYLLDNAAADTQGIGEGEIAYDTFTYTVKSQPDGLTSSTTLTFSIFGVNDPVTAHDDSNWVKEDEALQATGNVIDGGAHPGAPSGSDADAADTDPDYNDIITVTQVNGLAANVGGAVAGSYGTLTLNADGSYSYDLNNTLLAVQSLAVNETLTETFTYQVTDGHGTYSTATLTVTVHGTNDSPVANDIPIANDDTNWIAEDAAGTASGNLLETISHPGEPSGSVTFADAEDTDIDASDVLFVSEVEGTPVTTGTIIAGLYGALTVNADGSYSYALNNALAAVQELALDETATDSFDYTVSDGHGGTDSATLTVTIFGINDDPTLAAASAAATEDGASVDVDLALYGADVDSDDDGSSLTYAILTQPSEGSASIAGTVLTFDPGAGFQDLALGETRDVQVEVQATDSHGATASNFVTVTVTGVNDDPTLAAASAAATEDGASVDVDLSLYGADVDSDDDGSSLTYAILTQPSEGSASIAGTVLTFDPGADFQDLAFNETRDVQIEVQATDSHGATASNFVTVTVTGVNDDPVAANDTNWILEDSGLPTSGNVLADTAHGPDHADVADTDPDTSDILTVSAVNGVSSNVGIAVAGTYGTLTLQSDGSYSYTLDDLAPGLKDLTDGESAFDSFAYTIDDGNGGTATASLEIEVLGNGTIYDVPGATPTVIAAFETDDDFLDLSSLLDANFAPGVKADYVQATVDATGIMISVDTDGSANGASFVDVAHLDGVFSGTISYVYDGGTETVDAGIGVGM